MSNDNNQILVEGIYQGKNLYVQNPFSPNGVGFCVYEVRVNNEVTPDEINSSAFEIDLRNFRLKVGDRVEVKIIHKEGCKPKVLNPEVLKPKSTFELTGMDLVRANDEYTLVWETKGEAGVLPYGVQQFRWNKWVQLAETDGKGTSEANSYSVKVAPHSGKNQFRLIQKDYTGKPRVSRGSTFDTQVGPVTFTPVKAINEITFSSATQYEIYDQFGNIVKKGYGKVIDITGLTKGGYFLNYDNLTGEFFKK